MPYCRDCGNEIYGSHLYCGDCANEIVERSQSRIRQADEDEKRRMCNDRDYAHSWLQSLIGWIMGLMDLMSRIFSGGCYITTAVVAHKGLDDASHEMTVLRGLRDRYLLGAAEGKSDLEAYYIIGPILRNWINSRTDAEDVWEFVWSYVRRVVGLAMQGRDDDACALFKERTLGLRFDVLRGLHRSPSFDCSQRCPTNCLQRTRVARH